MRAMINNKTKEKLEVIEHILLRNFWEYYVLNAHTNTDNTKLCFVMGEENEIGDVYLPEINPYVISKTKNLNIFCAQGYSWAD